MCSSFPCVINQNAIKKKNKTKTFQDLLFFFFQEKPCPLEPLMSSVYKDIQSCFHCELRGFGTAASPRILLPLSSGALSFKPAWHISPLPPMQPAGRGQGQASLSIKYLPLWAQPQRLHPGPTGAKWENSRRLLSQVHSRFGFQSQLPRFPFWSWDHAQPLCLNL